MRGCAELTSGGCSALSSRRGGGSCGGRRLTIATRLGAALARAQTRAQSANYTPSISIANPKRADHAQPAPRRAAALCTRRAVRMAAAAPAPMSGSKSTEHKLLLQMAAGSGAGAATKTATAPLERIKIIFQVQVRRAAANQHSTRDVLTAAREPGTTCSAPAERGGGRSSWRRAELVRQPFERRRRTPSRAGVLARTHSAPRQSRRAGHGCCRRSSRAETRSPAACRSLRAHGANAVAAACIVCACGCGAASVPWAHTAAPSPAGAHAPAAAPPCRRQPRPPHPRPPPHFPLATTRRV